MKTRALLMMWVMICSMPAYADDDDCDDDGYDEGYAVVQPPVTYYPAPPQVYYPAPQVYYPEPQVNNYYPQPSAYSRRGPSTQGLAGSVIGDVLGYQLGGGNPLASGVGAAVGATLGNGYY